MRYSALALTVFLLAAIPGVPERAADPPAGGYAGLLLHPDISADEIVFSYANDLWVVGRHGGMARPLASPPGVETFPRFSADGATIAFVGNYQGNQDIYTLPAAGGIPFRVTHHPTSERLADWTPSGGLLFSGHQIEGLNRVRDLYTVGAAGGLPLRLPMPYGDQGAISPDGTQIAYTPYSRDNRTWKRYRGGWASDIWLYTLATGEAERLTDWEGTDTSPMWHGDTLYYLSDQGPAHRLNIWSLDTATGRRRQVTRFTGFDVKFPAIGPGQGGRGEIVFQTGGGLHILNLSNHNTRRVDIEIPGDRPGLATQRLDASGYIQATGISPTGARAVVQARGDIWTLPAANGSPRNLTATSGVAERDPAWSPDGRWIAYFTDKSGEYELVVAQSDGKGETRALTDDGGSYKSNPIWSPDSASILFSDAQATTWIVNVESGERSRLDTEPWGGSLQPSWSHDSSWIAYQKTADDNPVTSIWLYEVATGERTQVTSDLFNDTAPVFSRTGEWLFFSSDRVFSPSYSALDTTFIYDEAEVLVAVPLLADTPSPWAPESDEESWEEEDAEEEEEEPASEEAVDEPAPERDAITGTWSGTAATPDGALTLSMTLTLTGAHVIGSFTSDIGSGEMTGTWESGSGTLDLLLTMSDGLLVMISLTVDGDSATGTAMTPDGPMPVTVTRSSASATTDDEAAEAVETVKIDLEGFERRALRIPVPSGAFGNLESNDQGQLLYQRYGGTGTGVKLFDLNDPDGGEKSVASGGGAFAISGNGKKILISQGSRLTIQPASAGGSGKPVVTAGMNMTLDPRAEWEQMFFDVWRLYRDFFYVENMHGVDWEAQRDHYAAMLPAVSTREDLNYVIGELISELNVGHAYRGGGDVERSSFTSVGLLGADFALEEGAYRITAIHEGGPWDLEARGPLSQPGVEVAVGDWLLAVDGAPLDTSLDPWAPFVGRAGRPTMLTVSAAPTLDDDAREVLVTPMGSDFTLRYRAWIERNRAFVEAQTDGQIGYIYVPNTGRNGQNDLFRQFYGQMAKEGLIIDERWNGGGQIPTRFIELLNRPLTNLWAVRQGNDWRWPPDSHFGPKAMLINGLAGSGGDMFPWLFRQAGLGPLIGTRTWGGLVGISGNPQLIDGGFFSVPTFGFYEADGTWGVEGHGVDPDILVVDDPSLMRNGADPQLNAAIAWMLEALETDAFAPPDRPAGPDRSGMGVTAEDR